jgi:hypothetical protein
MATNRQHTAIHEAGHAVIARVLTLACGHASIHADEDSSGHAITYDPYRILREWEYRGKIRGNNAVWHGRIIALMAGAEAEREILGHHKGGDGTHGGIGTDRYEIALMAEEIVDSDQFWQRLEPRLRAITRSLVRRHRGRVERVAEALLQKGRLSSKELDDLAGRSINDVKANAPFLLEMHRGRKCESAT